MPRNQGTSRKGKPGKNERAVGLGRTLQRAQGVSYKPRPNGSSQSGGGMNMQPGARSSNLTDLELNRDKTKSVLELSSMDDFLLQAELANTQFVSERGQSGLIVIDPTSTAYAPPVVRFASDKSSATTDFVFKELSVPRRPPWDETTTPQQLEEREQFSFLEWRRAIARKEEELLRSGSKVSVTPFEKNLQVWRQLWRVLERSSCVLQLVDARNPLFYLSDDLRDYATSLGKPMLVLVNKSDYLSARQRKVWYEYLTREQGWDGVFFFSAYLEQQKLDHQAQLERRKLQQQQDLLLDRDADISEDLLLWNDDNRLKEHGGEDEEEEDDDVVEESQQPVTSPIQEPLAAVRETVANDTAHEEEADARIHGPHHDTIVEEDEHVDNHDDDCPPLLTRQELIDAMLEFAHQHDCLPDPRYTTTTSTTTMSEDGTETTTTTTPQGRIPFGMVGFPNVGKSSVINVLMGNSKHTHGTVKVGVAAQPGKTKHFQTLLLPGENSQVVLCDCPGLVFPSFVSNTADLIASGVYPIAQMRDPWPVMALICQRIPRDVLNATYGIHLPLPTILGNDGASSSSSTSLPPPTAEELLNTYCVARGLLSASSGVPDVHRASRLIIQDYAAGKLLYCHAPPSLATNTSDSGNATMTEQEYQQETLQTALRRTDKLADKLQRQQAAQSLQHPQSLNQGEGSHHNDTGGAESLGLVDDDDDDLLEYLDGGVADPTTLHHVSSTQPSSASLSHKKHFKQGKKGKKNSTHVRNNKDDDDPYGCHASPDDVLVQQVAASSSSHAVMGVGVKAGKYSRDAGYTRPSYTGARSATSTTSATSAM